MCVKDLGCGWTLSQTTMVVKCGLPGSILPGGYDLLCRWSWVRIHLVLPLFLKDWWASMTISVGDLESEPIWFSHLKWNCTWWAPRLVHHSSLDCLLHHKSKPTNQPCLGCWHYREIMSHVQGHMTMWSLSSNNSSELEHQMVRIATKNGPKLPQIRSRI